MFEKHYFLFSETFTNGLLCTFSKTQRNNCKFAAVQSQPHNINILTLRNLTACLPLSQAIFAVHQHYAVLHSKEINHSEAMDVPGIAKGICMYHLESEDEIISSKCILTGICILMDSFYQARVGYGSLNKIL
jgi:hypothetical protein